VPEEERPAATAVSDAEGRFRIEGVGPGAVVAETQADGIGIRIEHEDLRPREWLHPFARTDRGIQLTADVVLQPLARVEVSAVDENGDPVVGASVGMRLRSQEVLWGAVVDDEGTDASGSTTLRTVGPDRLTVHLHKNGHRPGRASVDLGADGGVHSLEIVLPSLPALDGILELVDDSGAPIADAEASISAMDPEVSSYHLSCVTDSVGRCALPAITPGARYELWGHHPDLGPFQLSDLELVEDTVTGVATRETGEPISISGRVRSGDATPIPLAEVQLAGAPQLATLTDAQGAFRIEGRTERRQSRLTLRVRAAGFASWAEVFEVSATPSPFDVVLERGAALRVAFVHPDGRALPAGGLDQVSVHVTGRRADHVTLEAPRAVRAGDGFVVQNVAPGCWTVNASLGGTVIAAEATVEHGDEEVRVQIEIPDPASRSVRSTQESGVSKPLS